MVYPSPNCSATEYCKKLTVKDVWNGTMSFRVEVFGISGTSEFTNIDLSFTVCLFDFNETAFAINAFFPWNNEINATYQIKGIGLRYDSDC